MISYIFVLIPYILCDFRIDLIFSFIPESPRWLLSNGRKKEANKILTKLAKRNHKSLAVDSLNLLEADETPSTGKIWQLFSTKTLSFRTIVICFNW